MIQHHPNDELLLAAAAGTLGPGDAIVLAAHLEGCARCRANTRMFEGVGGAMLESIEPALMASDALTRTLAAIDGKTAPAAPVAAPAQPRPGLPPGVAWPRSMAHCAVSRWHWMGPGMRWSRVTVPHAPDANVFLLRIGAGKALANHTHTGLELTHVMCGSFHDGRARFGAGDFDAADGDVHHQPVLEAGGECICLASVQGRLVFDGTIARWVGALVGI
ncbi:MAG: ChrR family anti-sigma-E factor [Burkholderiaceae bacterium]|nr:ChrR family anti-sigma-E factor [Burkholderiaceae bacterium]